MSTWHRLKLTNENAHGRGGRVFLDDLELQGVTEVTLRMGVNEPNRVDITMYVQSVNADVVVEEDEIDGLPEAP